MNAATIHPFPRGEPGTLPTVGTARHRLEAAIESAIALLDQIDPDADLEDGFDQEAVCEDEGAITGDDELEMGE